MRDADSGYRSLANKSPLGPYACQTISKGLGGSFAILSPRDDPQRAQRYSYLSPSGRTSRSLSLTGMEALQFGQYNSVALRPSNCFLTGTPRPYFCEVVANISSYIPHHLFLDSSLNKKALFIEKAYRKLILKARSYKP